MNNEQLEMWLDIKARLAKLIELTNSQPTDATFVRLHEDTKELQRVTFRLYMATDE